MATGAMVFKQVEGFAVGFAIEVALLGFAVREAMRLAAV